MCKTYFNTSMSFFYDLTTIFVNDIGLLENNRMQAL